MITYLDDCENPPYCAKCQQPECCKRLKPYGFPNAVKKSESSLFKKLLPHGVLVSEGVVWIIK